MMLGPSNIGVETGGAPGACAPPSFHKLLYKLLTTLCVVSNCAPPPNQKVFPTPMLCNTSDIWAPTKCV